MRKILLEKCESIIQASSWPFLQNNLTPSKIFSDLVAFHQESKGKNSSEAEEFAARVLPNIGGPIPFHDALSNDTNVRTVDLMKSSHPSNADPEGGHQFKSKDGEPLGIQCLK